MVRSRWGDGKTLSVFKQSFTPRELSMAGGEKDRMSSEVTLLCDYDLQKI